MTKTMKASECKAKFFAVLDEVAFMREPITVTKNGKPVAEIRPLAEIVPLAERPKSIIGALKGSVLFMEDMNEPLHVEWGALKE